MNARILLCWNRGLGDIPLGVYAVVHRIFHWIPQAEITILTRPDLAEGFELLKNVKVRVDPEGKRGSLVPLRTDFSSFDLVIQDPDPTQWCRWQLGKLQPKLQWKSEWDQLSSSFILDPQYIYLGAHVQTQTHYSYEKNWPLSRWKDLFKALPSNYRVLLFGFPSQEEFSSEGLIDLRGKTSLIEMLSLIKNGCKYLVVPDSGILSMVYYIEAEYPLELISLWADPHQGVLKQNVASANTQLVHHPLVAPNRDLSALQVSAVLEKLRVYA